MATEQKTTKRRPSGENLEDYDGHDRWSYRRWAWEFLRRNDQFIGACRALEDGDEPRRDEIAKQVGLKKFKP